MEITQKAYNYAVKCHNGTNHTYHGQPYSIHLKMVYDTANKFIHLIPEEKRDVVLAACWTHDIIEDCRETYNDVKKELGEDVAELVYALTNEKGKAREERANDKYYLGISTTPFASFIKACDRIANAKFSKDNGSSMFIKYKQEHPEFVSKLHSQEYNELFLHLDMLFNN